MVEGVEVGGGVETSVTNLTDVLQHAETDEGQKDGREGVKKREEGWVMEDTWMSATTLEMWCNVQ